MALAETDLAPPPEMILSSGIGYGDMNDLLGNFHRVGKAMVGELIEDGLRPDHSVLDVGCGLGRLARWLTTHLSPAGRYVGVDIVRPSIEWCTSAYVGHQNFRFIHADIFNTHYNPEATSRAADYEFPFPDASFDFVFSASLFTHLLLDDADNYLRQIARVLKPSGITSNTFMLLDDSSSHASKAPREGQPNGLLPHPIAGGRTGRKSAPEAVLAFYTDVVEQLHAKHGLTITEIRLGGWSGRTDKHTKNYHQDMILARRAR